jgi:hypothetical protein
VGLIDVEVEADDGRRWQGTLGTVDAVSERLAHHRVSGECLSGGYFWTRGLVIVRSLSFSHATEVVGDLVESGAIAAAFDEMDANA